MKSSASGNKFSQVLRSQVRARLESGASLSEIARDAGMAQSNLHRWFWDDQKDITLWNAEKLCAYLELQLVKRTEDTTP